ncbi:hypothetical protein DW020_04190 [Clostridium sp. AF37-5AT]|jgi:hypothetical protein|nr:hypothetical protein DW260_06590 [Clostridium sp. AM22-16AC]RHO37182.1 hypothetical protein DW181_10755 [Clostridium sp. AM16-23]RHO96553.1 hypothetical protein DW020_04190 [Clostridium sp. AF37-5AT]RHR05326.1 hypothetical protein DWX64_07080 [Clostridium sp. AF20-17LB]RHW00574.1 hypothetical protein DXA91_04310 [Clostridium sp. OF09-10]
MIKSIQVDRAVQRSETMIFELKWDKSAETAIQQIKDRRYADSVLNYTGNILLVGINYDAKTKKHECMIEKILDKSV